MDSNTSDFFDEVNIVKQCWANLWNHTVAKSKQHKDQSIDYFITQGFSEE